METDLPSADYARALASMTDEEVFEVMLVLEQKSEAGVAGNDLEADIAHRLALTEEEIGRRHPGQLLAPYRDWKKKRLLS